MATTVKGRLLENVSTVFKKRKTLFVMRLGFAFFIPRLKVTSAHK